MGQQDRKVGRRAKILGQTATITINTKVLTPDSTKTIFSSGNAFWIDEPDFLAVYIDGLVSGGSINPVAGVNDQVQTDAGSVYIGGALVSFAADASTVVTRPGAGGHVIISVIVVDASGVITAVAGTEGVAGGARGAAGGPPFLTAGTIPLGSVTLTGTVAAVVLADEISNDDAARYDTPSYSIDWLAGTVVLDAALPIIYSSSGVRKVYAKYKYAVMSEIGDAYGISLTEQAAMIDGSAFNDDWMYEKENVRSWSGSLTKFYINGTLFNMAATIDGGIKAFKFIPDRKGTRYLVGRAHMDWALTVGKDAMITENIPLKGIGPLSHYEA